jgi:hypothetical protein
MKVIALQSFHYTGPAGVAFAAVGAEIDLPDHLVESFVAGGRVRVVPAPAAVEQAPAATPAAEAAPSAAVPAAAALLAEMASGLDFHEARRRAGEILGTTAPRSKADVRAALEAVAS